MSRYDVDSRRGRDYAHGSDGTSRRNPRVPSPGRTTYNNGVSSQAKLTYEPQTPFYPRDDSPDSRPRTFPPPPPIEMISRASSRSRRERDRSRHRHGSKHGSDEDDESSNSERGLDWDSDENRIRSKSHIDKARKAVGSHFTDSPTGIGVGVLGAVLGGLAAREVADSHFKGSGRDDDDDHHHHHHHHHHHEKERKRNQLISTLVGAAVGALGANAIEKRIENHRVRDEAKQEKWERKWRPHQFLDVPGNNDDHDGVGERREMLAISRPRSKNKSVGYGGGNHRDSDVGGRRGSTTSRRGIEREVDLGARSWRNVEDWVLDGHNGGYPDGGFGGLEGAAR
ncbi:hypothetical protein F5Y17DRAFT_427290 [Xylariaceae sp. FL0594]|nr:hypothetical protein F5Y17DRAFT_427290 [Xylariaceae sp. FL0594]